MTQVQRQMMMQHGIPNFAQVTDAFKKHYQEYLSDRAASQVLGRWGLDMETFFAEWKKAI